MAKEEYSNWLSDQDYQKAIGQTSLQIGGILSPLRLYGQGIICDQAIDEIMIVIEQFGKRVRGKDVSIILERRR